jgi:hypothetical protein
MRESRRRVSVRSAPAFAHLGHRTAPSPAGGPSSAGTAAALDSVAAVPIQLSMNRPVRRLQPPDLTSSSILLLRQGPTAISSDYAVDYHAWNAAAIRRFERIFAR